MHLLVEEADQKLRELMAMVPVDVETAYRSAPKNAGVYAFFENGQAIYVGRTRRLRERLRDHVSGNERRAALAFALARRATGARPTYRAVGSRRALAQTPEFRDAFDEQRARLRHMAVRYVEAADPDLQTLLELYCARAIGAEMNGLATT